MLHIPFRTVSKAMACRNHRQLAVRGSSSISSAIRGSTDASSGSGERIDIRDDKCINIDIDKALDWHWLAPEGRRR
jgi:hypothetical protein